MLMNHERLCDASKADSIIQGGLREAGELELLGLLEGGINIDLNHPDLESERLRWLEYGQHAPNWPPPQFHVPISPRLLPYGPLSQV
jgi:hypothetical protein